MGKVSGAHLFVRTLKRHGIERIFGLCGDHVNSILNACVDEGISVIDVRHESAAAHMADGWARVTGQPAVSVVTGGPGHTNTLTGIATAWMAGSPLISVSGMFDQKLAGRGAAQEIDQLALVRPITKWAHLVTDPSTLPWALASAYREAVTGRPGPVHLSIPIEVSDALVDDTVVIPGPVTHKPDPVLEKEVETALNLLERAERPVVIAGGGVFWGRAEESLRQFVELSHIPCFTIGIGRGVVSDEHPLCFGSADQILNVTASEIKDADVVLLIGKRIDFRLAYGRLFGAAAALIHVDILAAELGRNRPAQLLIHGDARETLDQLVKAGSGRKGWKERPWVGRLREVWARAAEARRADERSDEVPVHPLRLLAEVARAVGEDVIWAIDGGDFAQWCRIALPVKKPGHWLRLGPMATVGAAIPFGIAAKLAKPESPVIVLTGDGGMGFHSWEMHTALRFNVPIVVVVGNDQGWGMERALQTGFYNRTIGVELGPVRYDKVIEAMGGHGEHVEHPAELSLALERALKAGKAACVNVMMRGLASPLTEANLAASRKPQL